MMNSDYTSGVSNARGSKLWALGAMAAKKFCGGVGFLALRHIWRHIIYVSNNRTSGATIVVVAADGNDEAIHLG